VKKPNDHGPELSAGPLARALVGTSFDGPAVDLGIAVIFFAVLVKQVIGE
jgi:hypothetical protein